MIYTQEPWEIQKGNIGPYIISKNVLGGVVPIAQVFQRGVDNCETDGNARLLKAAPKMYRALKEIIELMDNPIEPFEKFEPIATPVFNRTRKTLAEVEGKEEEDGS